MVVRSDGAAGEVEITVEGLPAGVTSEPLKLPPALDAAGGVVSTDAKLVLVATPEAAPSTTSFASSPAPMPESAPSRPPPAPLSPSPPTEAAPSPAARPSCCCWGSSPRRRTSNEGLAGGRVGMPCATLGLATGATHIDRRGGAWGGVGPGMSPSKRATL
jgi:hypothetical protein